ncbi:uncharacterized protein LOC143559588 [Bidens hawaiensis]|uniref:uncharacterized protein LOC143559588 n=1 Tax=Bidens hawaiensis TaxID=980011 RepID=UPI00404A0D85
MPLFMSDEEYAQCSGDPSLISQEADAYIRELYIQLQTQKAQHSQSLADLERKYTDTCDTLKRMDEKIKELESKQQIVKATSARIQFEPGVIQVIQNEVQFSGLPDEDPNGHIAHFLQVCDVLKINGATDDAIRVHLFPFSLRDKAKLWVRSLPSGSITTWDTMAEKFLSKYFPQERAGKLRKEIARFSQMDGESMYESWESYKDLLRRCPTHRLPLYDQVYMFYRGLSSEEKRTLN